MDNTTLLKYCATSIFLGILFWYLSSTSVSAYDVVSAIAKTPLLIIILIEIIDSFVDMNSFYSKINNAMNFTEGDTSLKRTGLSIAVAGFAFLGIMWALTGTLTLSLGSLSVGPFVASAIYAIYILMPNTGDDKLIFIMWLGATIATGGHYIILSPPIPGLETYPGVGTTLF